MLDFLQGYARWHGEEASFNLFKRMTNETNDLQHSYSWYRDQVLHPHETQHTLKEIKIWLKEIGFKLQSTSINNYKPLKNYSNTQLDKLEIELKKKLT